MKFFFIRTYGCQMNELDSEIMTGMLLQRGLLQTESEEKADLIIFNTCSVRDLAERKVMGKIGLISRKKKKAIIGIAGCMASLKKEKLLEKFPYVDFVIGTNSINQLNNILDSVIEKKIQLSHTENINIEDIDYSIAKRSSNLHAYLSIIRGCNNFCTYCIVPYARGREISRSPSSIIDECKKLADSGYKEITLLGQNVNSYGNDLSDKRTNFPNLLHELDKINGIERIRFLTSHPKDITIDLMHAIRDLKSVCEFVHFPFQSGSNNILKKMNRNYTKEDYIEKVMKLKEIVPNVTLGTDIIVGFPSEAEEDFLETTKLMELIRFQNAFIFAYSPRKNTPAYRLKDDVSDKEKKRRLQTLLDLFQKILDADSEKILGSNLEILVEEFDEKAKMAKGRSSCFKKVIFPCSQDLTGSTQKIKIKTHKHQTFTGLLEP